MNVEIGLVFNKPTPPNDRHFFFIVAGPDENQYFLCVNITSCQIFQNNENEDRSSIIQPGSHPVITNLSRAYYEYAECLHITTIREKIMNGEFTAHPVKSNPGLISRLQKGLCRTDALPEKYEYFIALVDHGDTEEN